MAEKFRRSPVKISMEPLEMRVSADRQSVVISVGKSGCLIDSVHAQQIRAWLDEILPHSAGEKHGT